MVDDTAPPPRRRRAADVLRALSRPKVGVMLALGFSSGLPFMLIGNTLSAWLADANVEIKTIGFASWIGLAYLVKFLWGAVVDHLPPPVPGRLGRRRGWMLITQCLVGAGLVGMAASHPGPGHLGALIAFGLATAIGAAAQDTVIDAWRIEIAADVDELGLLTSAYSLGFRTALVATEALILVLAAKIGWPLSYGIYGAMMLVGIAATIAAREPARADAVMETREADASFPARYARAISLYRQTEIEPALKEIDTLIAEQPNNPYLWELKGQVLFEAGRAREAEPAHRRSVELAPDAPLLRTNLAQALIAEGGAAQIDEAILHIRRSLSKEPDSPLSWRLLSEAYDAKNDPGMARLAAAEQNFYLGQMLNARTFAYNARELLKKDTPEWRRATDIILASKPTAADAARIHPVRAGLDAVVGPFLAFFRAHGVALGALMLAMITLYHLCDYLRGPMSLPFYKAAGIGLPTIAAVRASFGFGATLVGIALGGLSSLRIGAVRTLIIGAVVQPLAISAFALIAFHGGDFALIQIGAVKVSAFAAVMTADALAIGFSGVGLVAYMSSLTSLGYTATQYALLTSAMAWAGKISKGFSGVIVEALKPGHSLLQAYGLFYLFAAAIGAPAILLTIWLAAVQRRRSPRGDPTPAPIGG